MSETRFTVTDIDFGPIAKDDGENSLGDDVIKSEVEVKPEEGTLVLGQDELAALSAAHHHDSHHHDFRIVGEFVEDPGTSTGFTFSDGRAMTQQAAAAAFQAFKVEDCDKPTPHFVRYKLQDGKPVKVWECGICSKEFGHQYTLMRHLPTHTDERKFRCNTCGKAFRQMSTLSQHRAIHSAERPYICEICQKTFNRVSTLISHRKTHTGQKPHRCHLCNKAFHQKGNLRNHIFTHTNERPYKCDVCAKGFNQMSNLMCHKLKAHQRNDKPKYTCQICGRDFQKRMGLRNHEQYHHGVPNNDVGGGAVGGGNGGGGVGGVGFGQTRIKYTNGVLVDPIKTAAMQHALATNQTPFALLRPLNGIPVLVRVLAAGDKQMLVPATAEDLKKHGHISITPKTVEGEEGGDGQPEQAPDVKVNETKPVGSTVQIKIPVVATVVQCCGKDGNVCMAVQSPGPGAENPGSDNYIFTTTNTQVNENGEGSGQVIEDASAILSDGMQFIDEKGDSHKFYQQSFPFASQQVFNQSVQLENNVLHLEEGQENSQAAGIFKEIDADAILNGNMQIFKILDAPLEKSDACSIEQNCLFSDAEGLGGSADFLLQ